MSKFNNLKQWYICICNVSQGKRTLSSGPVKKIKSLVINRHRKIRIPAFFWWTTRRIILGNVISSRAKIKWDLCGELIGSEIFFIIVVQTVDSVFVYLCGERFLPWSRCCLLIFLDLFVVTVLENDKTLVIMYSNYKWPDVDLIIRF